MGFQNSYLVFSQLKKKKSKFMNEKMLQHQIMFKQLQELQRRQQLQELNNNRNQNYVNQLSLLKQASGDHSPTVHGMPIKDHSGMFTLGSMQMIQNGGSNGLFLSQTPVGLSQQQLDMYGSHTLNLDKNLNQYSHLQGPSNISANLVSKNNGSPLGMATMQPSAFGSSFTSQRYNLSADDISIPDGSVLLNQEKNLFGQASAEGFRRGNVPGNHSQKGITMQGNASSLDFEWRQKDACWGELSPSKTSNFGLSIRSEDPDGTSLDPLEQKILYNTDDNSWQSPFTRIGKMSTGCFGSGFEDSSHMDELPSLQSGSWSALMQSALEETSGTDPGTQEEWSGFSFQNSEPSNDYLPPNLINSKKLKNNWVNRNSPNAVSPGSKPEYFSQNFSNFQQLSYQYQQQREEYHSEFSHATIENCPRNKSPEAGYKSQPKHMTGGSQLNQTSLPSPNIWPGQRKENLTNDEHRPSLLSYANDNQLDNNFPGHEPKGNFWLQGGTLLAGGIQKPYNQVNNIHAYSGDPENMASGGNGEAVPTVLGPLECPGDYVAGPRDTINFFHCSESMLELLNKDDASNDQTPAMELNSQASTPGNLPLTETSGASFAKPWKISPLPSDFDVRMRPADSQTQLSHSRFPSLSMGTSSATSLTSHKLNSHVENQYAAPPASNVLQYESSYHNEYGVQEYSGKSAWHEQQLEKGISLHEGSNKISSSTSLSCNIQKQEVSGKYHVEADAVGSGSSMSNMQHQPSTQSEVREKETPSFPAIEIEPISHSPRQHSPRQNYSLLHEMHSGKNNETDGCKSFPPKYASLNYQHSVANDTVKNDLNAISELGAFWTGHHKGSNFSQEGQGDQSGKALSTSYNQNFQQKGMFGQNDIMSRSTGNNVASNLAYQSQTRLPTDPSWFKHYGTVKNAQMLPIYDPRASILASQPFSELALGNLQQNSLVMQENLANASQGSGLHLSTAATSITCKPLDPPSALPSDIANQNLAGPLPNKRKLVELDVIPWHKEVNHEHPRVQDISFTELSLSQASNRRVEEVNYEAESFEELLPVVRAKRRLVSTTQLVQQVFRPAPSVILCSDASSNCDFTACYAARLALGDACCLAVQLISGSNDGPQSPDKVKTSKRTRASKFAKVVECFIDRVKKLEGDLTRLEKSISFADIKVEALELEKFSTINRFAKFHIKAQSSTADAASSSVMQKPHPQRYVLGHPMPEIVPEGIACLSL